MRELPGTAVFPSSILMIPGNAWHSTPSRHYKPFTSNYWRTLSDTGLLREFPANAVMTISATIFAGNYGSLPLLPCGALYHTWGGGTCPQNHAAAVWWRVADHLCLRHTPGSTTGSRRASPRQITPKGGNSLISGTLFAPPAATFRDIAGHPPKRCGTFRDRLPVTRRVAGTTRTGPLRDHAAFRPPAMPPARSRKPAETKHPPQATTGQGGGGERIK